LKDQVHILKQRWAELLQKQDHQKTRIKDAANILGVSEAELLSTTINQTSTLLKIIDWKKAFKEISSLGNMMYLIRNDCAVFENTLRINKINSDTTHITLSDDNSIITINHSLIKYVFYTSAIIRGNKIYSVHLFDSYGTAIIKIYLKNTKLKEFESIKNKYKKEYNYELQKLKNKNLQTSYSGKIKTSSMRLMNNLNFSMQKYLEKISANNQNVEIKIFNRGVTAMYKGSLQNIIHKFDWLNIMDPKFNLHTKDRLLNKNYIDENNEDTIHFFHGENHILDIVKLSK